MIAGVDEAGRGPVIGPMVMAAVLAEEKNLPSGIADSKLLTPKKREKLFDKLSTYTHVVKVIQPAEIDTWVIQGKLNWLEAEKTAEMLTDLGAKQAIIDCPAKNVEAYKEFLQQRLPNTKIILEFKADSKYPVVGAASIIAKVTRDRIIEELHKKVGVDFGSGYPSDPKTQAFLQTLPKNFIHIRKSWQTYKDLQTKKEQQKLF